MTHAENVEFPDSPTIWPLARVLQSISALKGMLARYDIHKRNCKELRELNDDQLFDVGLNREDVERVCKFRFFRLWGCWTHRNLPAIAKSLGASADQSPHGRTSKGSAL